MKLDTILIVEDDLFQCKLLEKMLINLFQVKVLVAHNGREALLILEEVITPDMIFQ